MPRRRSSRFALEVLFLAAVAAAVTVAGLRPAGVIVLMAVAWVIVALLEWTAWLDEPHYGRGLPPRFYVPQVALPPPRAVEQGGHYPVLPVPDDEPTFVTAVSEWATALEEWPVLVVSPADEETQIAIPGKDVDDGGELDRELDAGPEPEPEPSLAPERVPGVSIEHSTVPEEPAIAPRPPLEPEPPAQAAGAEEPLVAALPPVEEVAASVVPERDVEPPEAIPGPAEPRLVPVERVATVAVHHIDPLTPSGRRRLFRRAVEAAVVEVPDGPPPDRVLPGRATAVGRDTPT